MTDLDGEEDRMKKERGKVSVLHRTNIAAAIYGNGAAVLGLGLKNCE